jgi:hypothetical protein
MRILGTERRRAARRGFSIMLAMAMLTLVAVTFATIALLLTTQVRRTRALTTGAQQRQYLLAGTQVVLAKLEAGKPVGEVLMALPAESGDAMLLYQQVGEAGANDVTVEIRATVHGSVARQTVRFVRSGKKWTVREAVLSAGQ